MTNNDLFTSQIQTPQLETVEILINQTYIGWRFDAALADLLPDYSRAKISAWIKNGHASMNDNVINGKDKIKQLGLIKLGIDTSPSHHWCAQDIDIDVVYEDEHIIVVNKPAGLVTHPGAGNTHSTLANALLNYDSSLSELDRAGIVHRLDKDTSGLMVIARSQLAQKSLIKQLQKHTVAREYMAMVHGHMISGGTIDAPIGRHDKDRIKQAVKVVGGKPAITHYRVIERFKHHTLLKVILETGRTHQIRVHMAHISYGLVSDKQYGRGLQGVYFPKGSSDELKAGLKAVPRHCLHSKKLSLIHPKTLEPLSWKSKTPQDIEDLLSVLRQYDV